MRRALAAALIVAAAATPAMADSKTLELGEFVGLDLSSGIKAVVMPGDAVSVVAVSSRSGDIGDLRTSVDGGVLRAWYDWSIWRLFDFSGRDLTLQITMPELASASVSSDASLVVSSVPADDLKLNASSNAHVTLNGAGAKRYGIAASSGASVTVTGTCYNAALNASSGANIDAKTLICADVTGTVSSGAHAAISATASVTAQASSGGVLTVYGHPATTQVDSSSGGRIDFPN